MSRAGRKNPSRQRPGGPLVKPAIPRDDRCRGPTSGRRGDGDRWAPWPRGSRSATGGGAKAGRHKGDTREFRELSFAEQAKSITATIDDLQAAIEHHIDPSPRRVETIETCLAQIDRLRHRLGGAYERPVGPQAASRAVPGDEGVPRVRAGSPRLAEPERAVDFIMEVNEVAPDAGVR